ncbi:peptide-N4-(N-acetyl-beta-D-glucosaminyl) asparaginase amidase N [Aspergillus luchuensis IFO 4308]|nr:peptide-N4-(N-acetyl-beta-D-glucosaminyl) asparaginase amidase N [Aspergillus luchuensis IFO 4308]
MLVSFGVAFYLVSLLFSPARALLEVFEVYQPVPTGHGSVGCNEEVLLMDHVFGYSYGEPYVGIYEPPNCTFDTVRINFTVTSKGRQYDRLALMYLGDTEVFRTSTAEPTTDGIIWTYIKDMSQFNVLWKEKQKLIFDLGNIITDVYTGSFNTTLTAYFSYEGNVRTPDVILPISARKSAQNASSDFDLPSDNATVQYQIPQAASRAVVSISACGQSEEEFWWSNVLSADEYTFDNTIGELYGYSPFREVQLYIDGILAGVDWPFPIIFTGGVAPGFWRPIVGIDAFDLRQPEIDITPFLPLLKDNKSHSFEIRVTGLSVADDGTVTFANTVNSYWSPNGTNETLSYSVTAERTFTVKSSEYSWSQNLSYSNYGYLNQQGLSQKNNQQTSGTNTITQLTGNNKSTNEVTFQYPLICNTTYGLEDGLSISAWIRRGLDISSTGGDGELGVSTYTFTSGPLDLHTEQYGTAYYFEPEDDESSVSSGETVDVWVSNAGGVEYSRNVRAVNGTVVSDTES